MANRNVCIVGAGLSGITSVKECVKQGLDPICYELESDLGGIWRPRDPKESTNSISLWPNFITNTSKWANSFSDFPPDPNDPPYQSQEGIFQYYRKYALHFKVLQYVKFNTRVIWIRKSPDHAETGQWEVFSCPTSDFRCGDKSSPNPRQMFTVEERQEMMAKCKKETFDCVFVCSGYFKYPFYPDVPGMSSFKGDIYHSYSYTGPRHLEDKNVLVVGNKFSATDITDDIATVAKQTYLAVGEGTWIIPRVYPGGRTVEQLISRDLIYDRNASSRWNQFIVSAAQNRLDHYALGIAPEKEPSSAPRGYGDGLAVKIMSGSVKLFGRLTELTSHEAHFKDGSVISDLDAVMFCTGYGADLSFLDCKILAPNGKMELYKMIFPLNEDHNTLAFIGVLGCDSPMAIVCEIQARLAVRVMAGLHKLPSQIEMKTDADYWNQMNWQLRKSYRYFLPGFVLMDSIANVLGVYPSFWKIFPRDPLLAYRVWYGSIVGAHYRLLGPDNQWEEAREFCHHQYEERAKCLRQIKDVDSSSRPDYTTTVKNSYNQWLKIVSFSAATCAVAFFISQKNFPHLVRSFNIK